MVNVQTSWDHKLRMPKPISAETPKKLAARKLEEKNYLEAINAFNQSLSMEENWDTYYGLGLALYFSHKYHSAIDACKKSIALKKLASISNSWWCMYITSKHQSAIDAFTQSIKKNEDWQSYEGLGLGS